MPLLPHDTWQNVKLAGVVIVAALLAVFLLWLLFSGEPLQKVCSAACLPACRRCHVQPSACMHLPHQGSAAWAVDMLRYSRAFDIMLSPEVCIHVICRQHLHQD